jgi:hypothetical protein
LKKREERRKREEKKEDRKEFTRKYCKLAETKGPLTCLYKLKSFVFFCSILKKKREERKEKKRRKWEGIYLRKYS